MMRLITLLILLFALLFLRGWRSNSIFGAVTDKETGEPVPFAYIHLEEMHRTTLADVKGRYELTNIPRGEFTLTLHRICYMTQTLTVRVGLLTEKQHLELSIRMSPSLLSSKYT